MTNNNQPQNGATAPNAPMTNEVGQQLAEALNPMRQEMIALSRGNERLGQLEGNNNNNDHEDDENQPDVNSVRPNQNGYFPNLEKVCRHLYLDLTEMMIHPTPKIGYSQSTL